MTYEVHPSHDATDVSDLGPYDFVCGACRRHDEQLSAPCAVGFDQELARATDGTTDFRVHSIRNSSAIALWLDGKQVRIPRSHYVLLVKQMVEVLR